jgi:hypothetical protein
VYGSVGINIWEARGPPIFEVIQFIVAPVSLLLSFPLFFFDFSLYYCNNGVRQQVK